MTSKKMKVADRMKLAYRVWEMQKKGQKKGTSVQNQSIKAVHENGCRRPMTVKMGDI